MTGGAAITDLHPMSVGDILDRSVRLYRRHFLHTLTIAAVPYVCLLPVIEAMGRQGSRLTWDVLQNPAALAAWSLLGLAAVWLFFLSMGALAQSISERYLGGMPGIWMSYRSVLRRTVPLLWAYFLSFLVWGGIAAAGIGVPFMLSTVVVLLAPGAWGLGIYSMFGLFLLVAAAVVIVAFFRLFLVTQVIVLENLRGPAALQRSWKLMHRNAWRAVAIFLFGLIVSIVVDFVVRLPLEVLNALYPELTIETLNTFLGDLGSILATPLGAVPYTLLYYDSRIRNEGFDLEMMAQGLRGSSSKLPPDPPQTGDPEAGSGSRLQAPAFRICATCGTRLPHVQLTCWKCGTRVSYRIAPKPPIR